ncbi:heterokaryon incompatibility protein-domain-containing protein [Rostrohypoxylon terebratum]|nr:heterokaryon incompatibility protein-domain-containing protein [Rostrohypoxylon terebratum]
MLCQTCQRAIRAPFDWDLKRELSSFSLVSYPSPHHFSLRSFYQSIIGGCFVCRWTWASLLQDEPPSIGSPWSYDWPPTFLYDPQQSIPSSLKDFYSKFAERAKLHSGSHGGHIDSKSLYFGEYTITRAASRAIIWIIQYLLSLAPRFNISEGHYSMKLKDWAEGNSGMLVKVHMHTAGEYHLSIECKNKMISRLKLRSADTDIPQTIERLNLDVRRASTGDTTELWNYWFTTCSRYHSECRVREAVGGQPQKFRPTRLIRLLHDDEGKVSAWKLDCDSTAAVPYLTLSHRWGSSHPIKLKKSNILEFQQPSPVSRLPKTYRDALAVTKSLGFSHIWIDSLCIIQKDEDDQNDSDNYEAVEDWRKESALMGKVYSHAECNIAASWATDSTEGCFSNSDPVARTPNFVFIGRPEPGSSARTAYQIGEHEFAFIEEVEEAPLNKRGWVVQERYLARRQLSFAKRQTHWECCELIANEEHPTGFLLHSKRHLPSEQGWKTMQETWAKLVDDYSSCDLTQKSDKLVALSGLASEVQNITSDKYMSGLWRNDLWKQLCWKLPYYWIESSFRLAIPDFNIPTWSWANIDGRVEYDAAYSNTPRGGHTPWIEVRKESTEQELVLRGVALWGHIIPHTESRGIDNGSHRVRVQLINKTRASGWEPWSSSDAMDVEACWDEFLGLIDTMPEKLSALKKERDSDLLFLVVRCELYEEQVGIILRESHGSGETEVKHVRMGMWRTRYGFDVPFRDRLVTRLGLSRVGKFEMEKHLDDHRIADLVHTVNVV